MKLFALHLLGGATDFACEGCVPEAELEHHHDLVSTALVDCPGLRCDRCHSEQLEPIEPAVAPGTRQVGDL